MRLLLLICSLFILSSLAAQLQEKPVLTIKGITSDSQFYSPSLLAGVAINIYDANKLIAAYQSDNNGNFEMDITLNSHIIIEFKKEGFFPKRILFDTQNSAIDLSKIYEPFNFEILLIAYVQDMNQFDSGLPITRIEYSELEQKFVYDRDFTQHRIKQQEMVMAELAKLN